MQFSQAVCFCHWRPSFLCHFTFKRRDIATFALLMHVGPIRMERPRSPNGNSVESCSSEAHVKKPLYFQR